MIRVAALATALVVAALLGAADGAAVQAQTPKLFGTVGPEFEISFRDAQGDRVTKLEPGTYDVQVRDLSDFHTFHLEGPGVDERTEVEFTGTVNWTVTFSGRELLVPLRSASDARRQVRRRRPARDESAHDASAGHGEDEAAAHGGTIPGHHPQDRWWQSGEDDEARHVHGVRPRPEP